MSDRETRRQQLEAERLRDELAANMRKGLRNALRIFVLSYVRSYANE